MTLKVHKIGGKDFAVMDLTRRTVRQDHFLLSVFQRTKIDKVSLSMDEDPKEYLIRLHTKLLTSGCACEVLSGFLIPVEKQTVVWSPVIAQEVQQHLELCDTEDDRQLVNQLAFEVMTGFFKLGLLSLLNSLRSLEEEGKEKTLRTNGASPESSKTLRGTSLR